MKPVPITAARRIGEEADARRVVVIALSDEQYCITTWGKTRRECHALAEWAESDKAVRYLTAIADARPSDGHIRMAHEPGEEDVSDPARAMLAALKEVVPALEAEEKWRIRSVTFDDDLSTADDEERAWVAEISKPLAAGRAAIAAAEGQEGQR